MLMRGLFRTKKGIIMTEPAPRPPQEFVPAEQQSRSPQRQRMPKKQGFMAGFTETVAQRNEENAQHLSDRQEKMRQEFVGDVPGGRSQEPAGEDLDRPDQREDELSEDSIDASEGYHYGAGQAAMDGAESSSFSQGLQSGFAGGVQSNMMAKMGHDSAERGSAPKGPEAEAIGSSIQDREISQMTYLSHLRTTTTEMQSSLQMEYEMAGDSPEADDLRERIEGLGQTSAQLETSQQDMATSMDPADVEASRQNYREDVRKGVNPAKDDVASTLYETGGPEAVQQALPSVAHQYSAGSQAHDAASQQAQEQVETPSAEAPKKGGKSEVLAKLGPSLQSKGLDSAQAGPEMQ